MIGERLPLRLADTGEAVRDLQDRLTACGHPCDDDVAIFGPATEHSVRSFQAKRGLNADGVVGRQTWGALVEAGFRLGDRLLYPARPMQRGDDVADLQHRLAALGFHTDRVDGIFGPETGAAVNRFQLNSGLTNDTIVGPETVRALGRLGRRGDGEPVTHLVESETLRRQAHDIGGSRLVVTERAGAAVLADAVGRMLQQASAEVIVLHDPDDSRVASQANTYTAEAVVGLSIASRTRVAYYGRPDYESRSGRRLAALATAALEHIPGCQPDDPRPMTVPLLRETRMPAIFVEVGPASFVVVHASAIAAACAGAIEAWLNSPTED